MHAKKAWSAGWRGVARVTGRLGPALVIFLSGYLLVYRPQQLRWGATDEEGPSLRKVSPRTLSVSELLAFLGHSSHVNAGGTSRFGGDIVSASASCSVI